MEINGSGHDVRISCSLDEVKEIYRALFKAMDLRSGDVDSSDALMDAQTFLYAEAVRQGVNLEEHSEWERFVGKRDIRALDCSRLDADCPIRVET